MTGLAELKHMTFVNTDKRIDDRRHLIRKSYLRLSLIDLIWYEIFVNSFAHDRNHLEKAMDNYEKLLEEFLTSTNFTNFTNACYQLLCEFENIQTDAIKQTCGEGTVEEIVNGQATCSKLTISLPKLLCMHR